MKVRVKNMKKAMERVSDLLVRMGELNQEEVIELTWYLFSQRKERWWDMTLLDEKAKIILGEIYEKHKKLEQWLEERKQIYVS